jgi:hypothetical protein
VWLAFTKDFETRGSLSPLSTEEHTRGEKSPLFAPLTSSTHDVRAWRAFEERCA